jgi:hypothetical protein
MGCAPFIVRAEQFGRHVIESMLVKRKPTCGSGWGSGKGCHGRQHQGWLARTTGWHYLRVTAEPSKRALLGHQVDLMVRARPFRSFAQECLQG